MSPHIDKTVSVLTVHESTVPHLDIIERAILDSLLKQGRAVVVPDEPVIP